MLGAGLHRQRATCSSAGLRWAIEQGFDVINMSLSTTKRQFAELLHELADSAYFQRHGARRLRAQHAGRELPVALLVGDLGREPRGAPTRSTFFYNPNPPVEFFARGVDVEVAWLGGGTLRCTGNSFATPHIAGDLRARPREAPRADAVPAEERPLPDRDERREVAR